MKTSSPRLVPGTVVVRPGDGTVQVGLDDRAVRVRDIGEPLVRFLGMLTGGPGSAVTDPDCGLPGGAAHDLLGALAGAGLLATEPAGGIVSIIGTGPLGRAIAELLCRDEVALMAWSTVGPDDADHPGAESAVHALSRLAPAGRAHSGGPRVVAVDHWSKPDGASPDVTVIATDGPECDRGIPEALLREGRDYLPVHVAGRGVRVGPYVSPGHSPCLRCCDLTRRGQNAAWPAVLTQLARVHGEAEPLALAWGAATAAAQVLTQLAGLRPETWAATLELGPPDWVVRMRRWQVHRDCGCALRTPVEVG